VTKTYGIHWFRRDLRIAGNPALLWNWKQHEGRVVGVFCFDKKFLAREDFSHNRFAFFLESLKDLKSQLQKSGGDLLFLDIGPEKAFSQLFEQLKRAKHPLPSTISYNRDYEPYAIRRDSEMEKLFSRFGLAVHTERDHLLIEPTELFKGDASSGAPSFYQVYSPFQRTWIRKLQTETIQARIENQCQGLKFLKAVENDKLDSELFQLTWKKLLPEVHDSNESILNFYLKQSMSKTEIQIPKAGSLCALQTILNFKKSALKNYPTDRDIPSIPGTSHASIYLKNGSITTTQIIAALELHTINSPKPVGERMSGGKYLNELIWREFYYHILSHRPDVEKDTFQPKYRNLKWENKETYFAAWKEGVTGYPIVDAGMRQLKKTGWMHNRVRMIVASFLTKDLLIDYRWGERHFMHLLFDGDLAPNNGGWQWGASTGCDPQPYFRIFNPVLQSERFDPEGIYIREYIPELKHLGNKEIHEPWNSAQKTSYPKRIVDHQTQKAKALALFKSAQRDAP
jgi:deoxyribodipyrimidine photo-lyase